MESPIVYGSCVGSREKFERIAERSIRLIDEQALILTRFEQASIFGAYNSILDEAQRYEPAAVVLVHDDLELRDLELESKLRALLADPAIAIIGVAGGRGIPDMAWWEGGENVGHAPDTFAERQFRRSAGAVDAVDGILLALSPWAIHHLRFDEVRFRGFHGYDADICRQATAAGKKVVVGDIATFHHTSSAAASATHAWHQALYTWRLKWLPSARSRRMIWRVKRSCHTALARFDI
jgi:hypothetical protein